MLKTIFISLIVLGGIGFIIYQMLKFFMGINSGKSRVMKDQLTIEETLKSTYLDQLVPLDQEEMRLLSMSYIESNKTDSLGQFTYGYYPSVYNEAVVAYGIRTYYNSEHFLCSVLTDKNLFNFHQQEGHTKVSKNGSLYGKIDGDGVFKDGQGNQRAAIETTEGEFHLIYDNKKELVHLRNSKIPEIGNQRMFPIVEDLDDANQELVLMMSMYNLIIQN